jgi:transposase-like protein
MKRNKWDSKSKWLIVLEGLKGKPVSQICTDHQICQSQYYKWRDQFLSEGHKVFETAKTNQKQLYLESENKKLRTVIGDLTLELKKSDDLWD